MVNRIYPTMGLLLKSFCVHVSMMMLRGLVHDPTVQRGILLVCRGIANKHRRRRNLTQQEFLLRKRVR